jgi:site-specific DNA recombinase
VETRSKLVIARGRLWLSQVEAGIPSIDDIAPREDCSKRHVNMMISLAFLGPNLVQAAFEGQLPQGVGVARLLDAPVVWGVSIPCWVSTEQNVSHLIVPL